MPTISMFYGILVSIYYADTSRHHKPHIHVRYQGQKASVAIEDGAVLAGEIPLRQLRMVQVWVDIHKDELLADWELAVAGDEPFRIAPLQ
jgi:hypothetical protein